ncbi:hypothetical protein Rhopal_007542-T1 [Rhodotorula paludigena]|uniref:Uncharacterized protein n=1 Tax=Rhodotorula paludigena TaxID=86838 RepID=A0AAV5GZP9_9BASI|nr:hypothetical protein Rhopal_007542-T1 [Rhodotorula paludigena]
MHFVAAFAPLLAVALPALAAPSPDPLSPAERVSLRDAARSASSAAAAASASATATTSIDWSKLSPAERVSIRDSQRLATATSSASAAPTSTPKQTAFTGTYYHSDRREHVMYNSGEHKDRYVGYLTLEEDKAGYAAIMAFLGREVDWDKYGFDAAVDYEGKMCAGMEHYDTTDDKVREWALVTDDFLSAHSLTLSQVCKRGLFLFRPDTNERRVLTIRGSCGSAHCPGEGVALGWYTRNKDLSRPKSWAILPEGTQVRFEIPSLALL